MINSHFCADSDDNPTILLPEMIIPLYLILEYFKIVHLTTYFHLIVYFGISASNGNLPTFLPLVIPESIPEFINPFQRY